MSKKSLEKICKQAGMPVCIQQAPVVKIDDSNRKMYYISMPHLQTTKHRFRTYPKPLSKIINL